VKRVVISFQAIVQSLRISIPEGTTG
jgi:hypothetical protein